VKAASVATLRLEQTTLIECAGVFDDHLGYLKLPRLSIRQLLQEGGLLEESSLES